MAAPIQFSTDDLRTPEDTERVLRQFQTAIAQMAQPAAAAAPSLNSLAMQLAPLLRNQLQAGGSAPLNLQSLLPTISNGGINIEDTHANRTTLWTPPKSAALTFYETDRHVFYVSVLVAGALVWQYAGGVYEAALGARPNDLVANDIGFLFYTIDTLTNYVWTGTAWTTIGGLYQIIQNSATASVTDIFILQHLLNNLAGANGMGVGFLAQLVDSLKATVDGSRIETVIVDATAATFTTKLIAQLRAGGAALADAFRIFASGAIQMLGKLTLYNNATPVDGQVLIGNTGAVTFDAATITGTAHEIIVTNGSGSITLSTPQAIDTTSSPLFAGLTVTSNLAVTATSIGFFGVLAQTQQADGAGLVNNVTSGGTTNQIDDFTNLTVYATDAATIRNDIYQLAKKLKIVDDALRLYGLLT